MRFLGLVCFFLFAGIAQFSNAGFVFQFDQPSYGGLTQGQTVTTPVFVAATGGDVINQLSGVNFILTGTGGNTTMATFTQTALFGSAGSPAGSTFTHLPTLGYAAPVGNRVNIGTLSFVAGTVGSVTNFTFSDPNPTFGNESVSGSFNGQANAGLDAVIFPTGPVSFTVTAVPEPSSIALLGLVGVGIAGVRRFRKKKSV